MEPSCTERVHALDLFRWVVLHVNDLYLSHTIEGSEPEKLLFGVPREQEKLSVFRLHRERVLPLACHFVFLVSVIGDAVDVEDLGEGDAGNFLGDLLSLNEKHLLLEVQNEEALVVECKREELHLLRHLEQEAFDLVFFVLQTDGQTACDKLAKHT